MMSYEIVAMLFRMMLLRESVSVGDRARHSLVAVQRTLHRAAIMPSHEVAHIVRTTRFLVGYGVEQTG